MWWYIFQSRIKVMVTEFTMWYMVLLYWIAFSCRYNVLFSGGLSWGKICFYLHLSFTLLVTAVTALTCIAFHTFTLSRVERMANRLRRWTRDQVVWGSISAALVMCKSIGQALIPHRLCPPSSNGYEVERKIGTVWMVSAAENALHSPQGDENVKEWVPISGGT